MTEPLHTLDPLRLPLRGSRLIEASAGTGKTWTIAALYLRLVLGHGGPDAAWHEALAPAQILVMTFTRAATQELRERIRRRLAQAAECFRGDAEVPDDDALLLELLRQYEDAASREHAAWRLAQAADAMDEAAVFTIDAWCQRMLREHAFDSGSLFDEQLLADDSELLQRAMRDVWRRELYPLRDPELSGLLRVWPDLESFAGQVGARVRRRGAGGLARDLGEHGGLAAAWREFEARRRDELAPLRAHWAAELARLRDWMQRQFDGGDSPFKANMVSAQRVAPWFEELQRWAQASDGDAPQLEAKAWLRLCGAGLREALKRGRELELPDGFDQLAGLHEALQRLPQAAQQLGDRACAAVEQCLAELKQQARSFGFVDLQQRLAQALDGAGGTRLRERMRAQYPVALIDEFQDTSALQYRLFDNLYRLGDDDPGSALLLIGDPKQSIYGFRGADIQSYLRARGATSGRHYVLHVNHRSTRELVQALNQLFGRAEQLRPRGAFDYRDVHGNPLPFVSVQARGRDEQLVGGDGLELPALQVEYGSELRSAGVAREEYAQACAQHVVGLLNDPGCGLRVGERLQRLRPRDIAVLVRTRIESESVRSALRRRGVASVYLSERESVFGSAEARDLLRWLRAVAEPRDAALARAALASATFELELHELDALAHDDRVFERHAELLLELHAVWQQQGVLPMLRATLHRLGLARRWLERDGGERRVTNVLHLAELLQRASATIDGEQALVRWLELAVAGRAGAADEQELRLESEADLVKVVTIHKSKGLEYPVVCIPFAAHFRSADDEDDTDEEQDGGADSPAGADGDAAAHADTQRLREDLRLLYVALTRARHALWVGAAALRGAGGSCLLQRSALGSLLGADSGRGPEQLGQLLQQALGGLPQVRLQAWCEPQADCTLATREAPPALHEPPWFRARFERDWSISSFSALVRNLAPVRAAFGARQHEFDEAADDAAVLLEPAPAASPHHGFPRGSRAGSFLHEQLAWLAEQDFADDAPTHVAFAQRCARLGWGAHADAAWSWLQRVLHTPLPPLHAALREARSRLAEMEFWFPADAASAAALDRACAGRWLGGRAHAPLDQRRLLGLVMGFADLVFEHEGRYWVLDYKSNALGDRDGDYHADALADAVAAHRYDVQAMLYLVALHRQLRARLGRAYDPARQLGGAICLFLRGIDGPARGCFTMPADIAWLQEFDGLLTPEQAITEQLARDPGRSGEGG